MPNPTCLCSSASRSKFLTEVWVTFKNAVPISLTYLVQNSLQTSSIFLCGRLAGQEALSVAAISYMWIMVTAGCIAFGGTTALDTMASTSFTASHDIHQVGILLQRAMLSLTIIYLPFGVSWWFMETILLALGQDPKLSQDTEAFMKILSFGMLPYIWFEAVKKFLQVQGIMHASTIVLVVVSPINVFLNWFCISKLELGFRGAALGTMITYWLAFLMICVLGKTMGGGKAWGGWSRQCFKSLWPMFKLSISGFVMVGTEWWAFEIVALLAGKVSVKAIEAQSVIMTLDQISATLPFGVGVSASARIGHLLGARQPNRARCAGSAAVFLATLVGGSVTILLMSNRNRFGSFFTKDDEVIRLVTDVLPYVAAFQIADGWAQSCGGTLRGVGLQHVGAIVNIIAYYLIALPLGIALAFWASMGLPGLWLGQCVALFLVGITEFTIIKSIKWADEVDRAVERLGSEALDIAPSLSI
ncbi:uncharacterized protein MELLADRAFT_73831 [Melampsora larici-populina 98AG31]|uniref:MOP flippase n=1 Tax=Melampsora larici-populina (strain 98AG31 / pathotype 3-4-7) TaxID=747676 RepID=F4R3T4_MELLP|nr:uncharacterized protein MELLADRAFT_73831 [Melampsora larici-populina 98AG31]EGG13112.1 hypothetical protein MELLADRAFT_73831 [Melampsora larici-populina 98AG31]